MKKFITIISLTLLVLCLSPLAIYADESLSDSLSDDEIEDYTALFLIWGLENKRVNYFSTDFELWKKFVETSLDYYYKNYDISLQDLKNILAETKNTYQNSTLTFSTDFLVVMNYLYSQLSNAVGGITPGKAYSFQVAGINLPSLVFKNSFYLDMFYSSSYLGNKSFVNENGSKVKFKESFKMCSSPLTNWQNIPYCTVKFMVPETEDDFEYGVGFWVDDIYETDTIAGTPLEISLSKKHPDNEYALVFALDPDTYSDIKAYRWLHDDGAGVLFNLWHGSSKASYILFSDDTVVINDNYHLVIFYGFQSVMMPVLSSGYTSTDFLDMPTPANSSGNAYHVLFNGIPLNAFTQLKFNVLSTGFPDPISQRSYYYQMITDAHSSTFDDYVAGIADGSIIAADIHYYGKYTNKEFDINNTADIALEANLAASGGDYQKGTINIEKEKQASYNDQNTNIIKKFGEYQKTLTDFQKNNKLSGINMPSPLNWAAKQSTRYFVKFYNDDNLSGFTNILIPIALMLIVLKKVLGS